MALIVQKFGGSSVATPEKLEHVASIITDTYEEGNQVVVVVSAQGDTTNHLIEKAETVNPKHSRREMDQLLSAGEQMSIALLAMAVERKRIPVVSLLGWQAGVTTNSTYMKSRVKKIGNDRIVSELSKNKVVIVAGFQGVNKYNDITTLGRGGSDTSAVALAAALRADRCQIFTDVEGIYTTDPRKVEGARKLKEITYDEMLELATLGAKVLNNRSVEMAKKYHVKLEVLSSITNKPGTMVKEVAKMEKMLIRGVTKDDDVVRISITKLPDTPGVAFRLFEKLASEKINVDIILQSVGRDGTKDITFTVERGNGDLAKKCILDIFPSIEEKDITIDREVAKISIVGAGMETHPGTAARMFDALYSAGINIQMISTSEIKISVLVNIKDCDRAVTAVHNEFFPID